MIYVNRTLTRCIGYGCFVGGILAGTSTLAHAQDYPPYYSQASRVHIAATYARQQSIASGTAVVPVNTSARWTSSDGSITRYRTSTINVPKSTLRVGALSAMSRGIMHPGWQAAILAAGYIFNQQTNEVVKPDESVLVDTSDFNIQHISDNGALCMYSTHNGPLTSSPGAAAASYTVFYSRKLVSFSSSGSTTAEEASGYTKLIGCPKYTAVYNNPPNTFEPYMRTRTINAVNYSGSPDPNLYEPTYQPLDEQDWDVVESYIPPQLYDELWNGEPIPEWQDTISVLGSPASDVSSDGALAPELADAVGRWGENMDAQYNGDEAPHTDHPTTGNTAQEQVAEDTLDGDIPSFPEPEVLWQTETIDLPSYSSGIGAGSCPAGATIPLPLGANPLQFSYQPACDLATMVRPALIGICGLIALMIVLRARGGA